MSVELEGLNNLLVKLQDTQNNYVDVLENETDIVNAHSWYDAHDRDILILNSLSLNICPREKETVR